MWIYSTKAAVFGNNITASYYSRQGVWSTAYEIVHSERFADSSIVVPFGCAALVLLTESERQKFRTRCALMIFLHYADDHPLFTYAFYSPKTKRVVHRQNVILLASVFPMRSARSASGFHVEGDALVTYRSPPSVRDDVPDELSFHDWSTLDPPPDFSDEISGFELTPPAQLREVSPAVMVDSFLPVQFSDHPSFGVGSAVPVPIRSMPDALPLPPPMGPSPRDAPVSQDGVDFAGVDQSQEFLSRADASFAFPDLGIAKNLGSSCVDQSKLSSSTFAAESDQSPGLSSGNGRFSCPPDAIIGQTSDLRSDHIVPSDLTIGLEETDPSSRRRVNQRWYYEPKDSTFEGDAAVPVLSKKAALQASSAPHSISPWNDCLCSCGAGQFEAF
jgi:hypothetical protein